MRTMVRSSLVPLLALLAAPVVAFAQSGPELLLKPWDKEEMLEARASAIFQSSGEFEDDELGGADLRITHYESEGRIRILPGNIASPRIGYKFTHLDIDTDLPGFPDDLTDQSATAGVFLHRFQSGWILGTTLGAGYAGENAYSDANAWYFKGTVVFGREVNENNALAVVVDYDGNRVIFPDIPIIGFAWVGKLPERNLQITAGFPIISVLWNINERTTAEATWTFSDSLDGLVRHEFTDHWSLFARFETRNLGFHIDELEDANDRLFFHQRRIEGGVQWMPAKYASLVAAAGYAFVGEFSTGWDMRDVENVLEIADEPYVRLGLELRF
jgi:hypothetical protein